MTRLLVLVAGSIAKGMPFCFLPVVLYFFATGEADFITLDVIDRYWSASRDLSNLLSKVYLSSACLRTLSFCSCIVS